MRIISGELKGKKILIPEDKSTRPLKDMVKESIFNIIEHSTKFSLKIFAAGKNFISLCLEKLQSMQLFSERYNTLSNCHSYVAET